MTDDEIDLILRQVDDLLRGAREQRVDSPPVNAGSPVPAVHPWQAQPLAQRYAHRARTHGYPLGLAKSARNLRDTLRSYQQTRNRTLPADDRVDHEAAHEALAWALDAERFLGSLRGPGGEGVRDHHIDDITENLLVWLRYKGYAIMPLTGSPSAPTGSEPAGD